jgi:hypothetical protein
MIKQHQQHAAQRAFKRNREDRTKYEVRISSSSCYHTSFLDRRAANMSKPILNIRSHQHPTPHYRRYGRIGKTSEML